MSPDISFVDRLNEQEQDESKQDEKFIWVISADKIFSSEIINYKDFAVIFNMEYSIKRFCICDGSKMSDTAVLSEDVIVRCRPGKHCPILLERLAKGTKIPKITAKKIFTIQEKMETIEEKEFSDCVVQSFKRHKEVVTFSFRSPSVSYKYNDFAEDGNKKGSAAVSIKLAEWKIEGK